MTEELAMSDSRFDRGIDSRREYLGEYSPTTGWITSAIVLAFLMLGVFLFSTSADRTPTASNPSSETTGQSERAPAPTIPANPM
jgi:hypothetical protein